MDSLLHIFHLRINIEPSQDGRNYEGCQSYVSDYFSVFNVHYYYMAFNSVQQINSLIIFEQFIIYFIYYIYPIMSQRKWIFSSKDISSHKSKIISKPKIQTTSTHAEKLSVTYKFKTRKQLKNSSDSLQNFRDKLNEIYQTCKALRLPRAVFLMAINIFKKLINKHPNTSITGPQTLACLTLATKFQQCNKNIINFIVCKTKMTKSEVFGAELYIFEELNFKLPFEDTFYQDLQRIIQEWNNFVEQNYYNEREHFVINKKAPINSQSFQNYGNLIVAFDFLLVRSPQQIFQNYRSALGLGLYFIIIQSGYLVFHNFNFNQIIHQFCLAYGIDDQIHQCMNKVIDQKDNDILFRLGTITMNEYNRIKQFGTNYVL